MRVLIIPNRLIICFEVLPDCCTYTVNYHTVIALDTM